MNWIKKVRLPNHPHRGNFIEKPSTNHMITCRRNDFHTIIENTLMNNVRLFISIKSFPYDYALKISNFLKIDFYKFYFKTLKYVRTQISLSLTSNATFYTIFGNCHIYRHYQITPLTLLKNIWKKKLKQ